MFDIYTYVHMHTHTHNIHLIQTCIVFRDSVKYQDENILSFVADKLLVGNLD